MHRSRSPCDKGHAVVNLKTTSLQIHRSRSPPRDSHSTANLYPKFGIHGQSLRPSRLSNIRDTLYAAYRPVSPLIIMIIMSLPHRSYFLSPLNAGTHDSKNLHSQLLLATQPYAFLETEMRNRDQILAVDHIEVQTSRLPDIKTTFYMAFRDRGKPALLLLAEALRVRILFSHIISFFLTDSDSLTRASFR
jgi:hypothetical protein